MDCSSGRWVKRPKTTSDDRKQAIPLTEPSQDPPANINYVIYPYYWATLLAAGDEYPLIFKGCLRIEIKYFAAKGDYLRYFS